MFICFSPILQHAEIISIKLEKDRQIVKKYYSPLMENNYKIIKTMKNLDFFLVTNFFNCKRVCF